MLAEGPESAGYRGTYHMLEDLELVQDTAFDDSGTLSLFSFCVSSGWKRAGTGLYEPGM